MVISQIDPKQWSLGVISHIDVTHSPPTLIYHKYLPRSYPTLLFHALAVSLWVLGHAMGSCASESPYRHLISVFDCVQCAQISAFLSYASVVAFCITFIPTLTPSLLPTFLDVRGLWCFLAPRLPTPIWEQAKFNLYLDWSELHIYKTSQTVCTLKGDSSSS